MAFIGLTCPHCLKETQLKVIGFNFDTANQRDGMSVSLGTFCPGCLKPVAVEARRTVSDQSRFGSAISQLLSSQAPLSSSYLAYVDHWPKPPSPTIPEHLPPSVEKAFMQAEGNFPREGYEESSGMMYRRALELGLGEKYPEMTGNLAGKIRKLVEDHVLTTDLGEWATEVRLVGNDAAHAPEVTRDDLEMMRAFADAVLRYVWTLPTQVQQRRAAKEPPKAEEKTA
jgi:hypothetical protein